ncbi:MAG: sugar ABC transporter permease [Clostridia bacterium]|nr:sugar ABC transporter permease [Clostridia bacterium]
MKKLSETKEKRSNLSKRIWADRQLYFMLIPFLLFYVIFVYKPMWGLQVAFKDYNIFKGMSGSPWVGFENFKTIFGNPYFFRILRNTLLISTYSLIFSFPMPIILALLLNEVRIRKFKSLVQTCTYLPYFISTVVVAGMVTSFLAPSTGMVNLILAKLGFEKIYFLSKPEYFRTIFITQGIWQNAGYSSIVYIAALGGIDMELYDAAMVDGCGRWKQTLHVTLPGLLPTIVTLFIISVGNILNVGYEKIILLYQPATYETADVISTYVYRLGVEQANYGVSTAMGLFNSVVGFVFVYAANKISNKINGMGLW